MSHEDIITFIGLMLKPGNLAYVLFGFGQPKDKTHVPTTEVGEMRRRAQ